MVHDWIVSRLFGARVFNPNVIFDAVLAGHDLLSIKDIIADCA
jgi:hypothetical protein